MSFLLNAAGEPDPRAMYAEFEFAKRYWDAGATLARSISRKAAGEAFWGGDKAELPNPENYYGTHTLHTKASLGSGQLVPRFSTKKRDQSERVEENEAFCRQWSLDTQFDREYERVIDRMCNGYAWGLVSQVPRRGYEQIDDGPNTPAVDLLRPQLAGCDPIGGTFPSARYVYHVCIHVHSELVSIAESAPDEWNVDAVRRMKTETTSSMRGAVVQGIDRKEVSYVSMWVPGYTLPPGDKAWAGVDEKTRAKCHGTIFKFAVCRPNTILGFFRDQPDMIAPPRPYYGPRQGPYVYDGFLDVPDEVRHSSPLIANMGQIEQLNAQERANDLIEQRAKTVFAYDGMSADDAQTLEDAKHGDAVRLAGLDSTKSATIDFPGITGDKRARSLELAARVRRNLGMPDTALGEASGAATLGENQIADAHLQAITEMLDRRACRWAAQVFLRVAWFAENDSRTIVEQDGEVLIGGRGRDDGEQGIERAARSKMITEAERQEMLRALPPEGEEEISFDDLGIIVERVKQDGQSLARFQQSTEFLTVVAPLVPLIAQAGGGGEGFQKYMERAADEYGVSEMASVFDMQAAADMAMEAAGAAEEARTAPAPEQPVARTAPGQSRTQKNKPEAQAVKLRKVE
jgi:hypothetical protein